MRICLHHGVEWAKVEEAMGGFYNSSGKKTKPAYQRTIAALFKHGDERKFRPIKTIAHTSLLGSCFLQIVSIIAQSKSLFWG
jgi:hypothetical protein